MRALVHDGDLARDVHRLLLIVRDEDRRDVHFLVQAPEPVAELGADARVERAERLVEKEDLRVGGERAREGHSLALSARQLRGIATGERFELDEPQQLVDALADLRPWRLRMVSPKATLSRTVMCLNAA